MATRALLLDFDGTLADSMGVARRVYDDFLLAHRRAPTDVEFEDLNGPPLTEVIRRLKMTHQIPNDEHFLLAHYEALLDEAYLTVQPNGGASELLERARRQGYRTGIVTSNSARRVRKWLENRELADQIDLVIASEDVQNGKPHPEPYLLALHRSGTAASDSVAVEDSMYGAQAALSAGLRTFLLSPVSVYGKFQLPAEKADGLLTVANRLWA